MNSRMMIVWCNLKLSYRRVISTETLSIFNIYECVDFVSIGVKQSVSFEMAYCFKHVQDAVMCVLRFDCLLSPCSFLTFCFGNCLKFLNLSTQDNLPVPLHLDDHYILAFDIV